MCDNHGNEMSSVESANQLIAPNEIKQEPDIKVEPMTTDDLVEFPAIINGGIGQPLGNPSRYSNEGDIENLPLNEVKSEVKPERTNEIKKKESKHLCDQCEYATNYKSNLIRHLRTHSGEKPFPCNHCPKEFTRKFNLQNHIKFHIEEFLFNCVVCLKGFDKKNEKLAHEKDCSIRQYECHLCKHLFGSQKGHLMKHIRAHSGVKQFQCKECSKQFTEKGNLKRHMKLHAGPRSFHCSRCRQRFVQQTEMVAHEQKCSRRVYECYVCGKFIGLYKGNLEYHMRTHSGDKPFQCLICECQCTLKENLTKHMNRIHNKIR